MNQEDLDDAQINLDEVTVYAKEVLFDLYCAESCETTSDFKTNLECALENAQALVKFLAEQLEKFK